MFLRQHQQSYQTYSQAEAFAALRLSRSRGIGAMTFTALLSEYSCATKAISELEEQARNNTLPKKITLAKKDDIQREWDAVHQAGGQIIAVGQEAYPETLSFLGNSPPVLTVLGDIHALSVPMLAVVGTRNSSMNGQKFTGQIVTDVVRAGYGTVSGLARGIDTVAHTQTLRTEGVTVAVLANGLSQIYPPENQKLAQAMLERGGALISDQPWGTAPAANLFPRRNRIIAGLALGTLVIEATQKSGSLITAREALDAGREVFAVPGHPLDPRAAGPNHLIKNAQAHLVSSGKDVLSHLRAIQVAPVSIKKTPPADLFSLEALPSSVPDNQPQKAKDTPKTLADRVLSLLGPEPIEIDQLTREIQSQDNITSQKLLTILSKLELMGQITRHPGQRVSKVG